MIGELKRMLGLVQADYADIRYELRSDAEIVNESGELKSLSSCEADGFVLRVLAGGGFATIAFTRPEDAPKAAAKALADALLLSRLGRRPVRLAPVAAAVGKVLPRLGIDPASRTMEEKVGLLEGYDRVARSSPRIAASSLRYFETRRDRAFASTEGAEVEERLVTTGIQGMLTSRSGALVQNIRCNAGGSDGYGGVLGLEPYFEERARLVVDLLDAAPAKGGAYSVVLNPNMAGVFTHEAFGHFSEADIIEDMPSMRARMRLGERLGAPGLTIVDDPAMEGVLGHYRYDDEGVPARRVVLMEDGVLRGRLHSRRTAAAFGEEPNGHAVAEDYRYAPIVRMGTIFIEPRGESLDSLLAAAGEGLYLLDAKGGQTAGRNFTFGAQYGYEIKGGKRGRMVRDINISGDLYETLGDIEAIGSDFYLSKIGGCGKGQTNIRSCHGGPHVLVRKLVVGGA